MPIMSMTNSSRLGVQATYKDMWRQQLAVFEETQKVLFHTAPYHTALETEYAFKDATPKFERWHRGEERTYKAIRDRLLSCIVLPYQLGIEWDRFEKRHDQIGDVEELVGASVDSAFQIADQLPLEYLNGTAVLNDVLANCWDGASLFSAVDGAGANRMQVSGGNVITGSGATIAGLALDLQRVQQRALNARDTAGKPIFKPQDVEYHKMVVLAAPQLLGLLQALSKKEYIRTDLSNNTSESNFFVETFDYHTLTYLTNTSDFYVVIRHDYWKPFIFRPPTDLQSFRRDPSNSDRAANLNIEAMVADVEMGIQPWSFHVIYKIDNS